MFVTIYKKTTELLKKDEELAKEYFYNAITNMDNIEDMASVQIANLFEMINFKEKNAEFKLSVLQDANLAYVLDDYTEKKIFLNIINKHESSRYLQCDSLDVLMERYSNIPEFIDDTFVEVILRKSRFIDEDAIYYILKSKGFSEISDTNVNRLLKAYDLYEDTMAGRVLHILESEEFVERIPHRKLVEFIERVSLNLDSKESKNFIVNVVKTRSMKNLYIGNGNLYDFRYIEDNRVTHINELLFKKDYYKKLLLATDREKAYELINYYLKEDPFFLEYFKYASINDNSMKLDKDLLFGLIKSDYQDILISITNSKMGELFVKCANYLNERYPNFNVAKLIKLLNSGLDIPEKFLEEVHTHDIAMITNYLLYGTNIYIESIEEYEYALMDQLDLVMRKNVSMSQFKDALCRNRYGFGFGRVHALYKMYRDFVFKCDNERIRTEFKEFEDIIYGKDKNQLYKKYMTNIFTFDKANKYEMDIKRAYTEELKKNIISQKDLVVNSMILHNQQAIPVVELEGDFNMLISAVGFVTRLEIINENYKDSLLMSENHELHTLSASIYSSDNLARAKGKFVLGYSDFPDHTIQHSSPMDIYSTGVRYDVFAQYPSTYVHPKDIPSYTRHDYNELVIERRMAIKKGEIHLSNIYPTYVLLDDRSPTAVNAAVKASKDLGIPIVFIDPEEIRKKKREEYKEIMDKYKGKTFEDYKRAITLTFREKNAQEDNDYFMDYGVVISLTDIFLMHEHTYKELLEAEQLLILEINKGAAYDYSDVYRAILKIRRKMELIEPIEEYVINEKYSPLIDREVQSLVKKGYLTQRHNGIGIKDARALANASVYVYELLAKKYGWSYSDIKEVIQIALYVSSNMSEFKYDYYLNRGNENDNFYNYYKAYANLKQMNAKVNRNILIYILNYLPVLGHRAIRGCSGYEQVINLAHSIIEGESLIDIASYLGVKQEEIVSVRNRLIDIYNNKSKTVERKKK